MLQDTEFAEAVREIESIVGDRDLRLLTAKLVHADRNWLTANVAAVVAAADALLDAINVEKVAAYFGVLVRFCVWQFYFSPNFWQFYAHLSKHFLF